MEDLTQIQNTDNGREQNTPAKPTSTGKESKKVLVVVALVAVILLAAIIAFSVFLFQADAARTAQIRDVFIIVMALEALLIGAALIILSVQIAILINLLQNEVKPILNSTTETVNTLRGTVSFLSNNLTEPVIKMNEYLAGIRKVFDLIRIVRK